MKSADVATTTTAGFTASSISKRYGQTLALDEVTISLDVQFVKA